MSLGFGSSGSALADLLTFTSEMKSLLALKAPMDRCLRTVAGELPPRAVRKVIEAAADKVTAGLPLSDVLAEHPSLFPENYVRSIATGEKSGELANTFSFLARHLESQMSLQRKLRSLSVYPVIVLGITALLLWFLLTWLVPVFEKLIVGIQEEGESQISPLYTFLISISNILTIVPGWVSLLAGAVVGVFVLSAVYGDNGSRLMRVLRKMPWLKRINEESSLAVLSGVLGTTLRSGVPLDQALFMARDTLEDPGLRDALSQVARGVQNGEKVGPLLERSGKFPPTFTWLVSMSEEEGKIAAEMLTLSERYYQQAGESLSQLEMVTKPAIMVFLCLIAASVIIPMFLAIVNISGLIPTGGLG